MGLCQVIANARVQVRKEHVLSKSSALLHAALLLPVGAAFAEADVDSRENPVPMGEGIDIAIWGVRVVAYNGDATEYVPERDLGTDDLGAGNTHAVETRPHPKND